MTTPDPAATLRAAAARLRALAAEATPGPWLDVDGPGRVSTMNDPVMPGVDVAVLRSNSYVDATWAAALGPQVAEPLAAWLEVAAGFAKQAWMVSEPVHPLALPALDFARAVLAAAPADGEGGAG